MKFGNGGDGGSGGGAGGVTSGGSELTRGLATPPGQGNNGSEGWGINRRQAHRWWWRWCWWCR